MNYCNDFVNVGDNIAPVIVEKVAQIKNIDLDISVPQTVHLYTIGSILTAGAQDCTVWGSGLLNTRILNRLDGRCFDIRAVRGPLTRIVLADRGISAPEVYGDPAILMPMIYNPTVEKKYKISVITHMDDQLEMLHSKFHCVSICTHDWEYFVREVKRSELIVSSSLHGIIFAETYGIPAILLKPHNDLFKYYDYYYSTERYEFPIIDRVMDAFECSAPPIPDFTNMRQNLLASFPEDIFQEK